MRTWTRITTSILLLASVCHGQATFRGQNVAIPGGTSITGNFGGTVQGQTDTNDGGFPIESSFITPATTPTFDGKCYHWFNTTTSAVRGCALYADNADNPDGGTFICGMTTTSNPGNGVSSLQMSGCPGTLSANTEYHIAYGTQDNSEIFGTSGTNSNCPYSGWHSTQSTINLGTGWPGTWSVSFNGTKWNDANGCYTTWINLVYTSSATYNLVSINPGACDLGVSPCAVVIPAIKSGHGLLVIALPTDSTHTVSSVTTTTAGTTTDLLAKRGTCAGAGPQWCFYQIDRATAGADGVSCAFTFGGKVLCIAIEIQGTAASSSFDKMEVDGSFTNAQTFTSGNTATTTQATELLIGFVYGGATTQAEADFFSTNGGAWNLLLSSKSTGISPTAFALYTKTVTSTGAYNLTGTFNANAASNNMLPGLITLK